MKSRIFLTLILLLAFIFPLSAQQEIPQNPQEDAIEQEFVPAPEDLEEASLPDEPVSMPVPSGDAPAMEVSALDGQNKISFDIKGMDITDVLKMLSTRAGINIVVGKNVTGRVTLFLKNVDVWDAFEIILAANDLAYEKKGNIVNVMTQRDYELLYGERFRDKKRAQIVKLKYAKATDLAVTLSQIKTNTGRVVANESSNTIVLIDTPEKVRELVEFIRNADLPLQTKVFLLEYAPAEKLSAKLQEAVTKGVGSVRIDERTNKIVITDYPSKLDELEKLIKAFDDKTPQVLIDAQLIQINPSDKFEMGVDWDYWVNKYFEAKIKLPINTDNALIIGTPNTTPSERGKYKAVLDILRTIGDTKVLSSPRIMCLNNQEARILVGTKEAYITSTTSQGSSGQTVTAQSVNFVDTGIELKVTPTINRDNFITMKIRPQISEATSKELLSGGQKTTVPIVTSSEAETTVTVKDGVTLIIGGLKKDKREKTVKKIPLLGDIPGLGFLFRSTSDNLTKNELVILLTPHIITGESTYSSFSEIRPMDGVVAEMVKGNIVTKKINSSEEEKIDTVAYYKLISEKVKGMALSEYPAKEKGEVRLEFILAKDGKLLFAPLISSTDNSRLSSYAVKAVKKASPFPPFPRSFNKKEEAFSVTLLYE